MEKIDALADQTHHEYPFVATIQPSHELMRTVRMEELERTKKIDRLYALLERDDVDEDTKAALRWAIFELERK